MTAAPAQLKETIPALEKMGGLCSRRSRPFDGQD